MENTWYTGIADELARCLSDARICAEACEDLLERVTRGGDGDLQRRIVATIVAPAAVSRVLIDLIDHPQQLVLAAATLCRDTATDAARQLADVPAAAGAVRALTACADSCAAFLDAV
jgi:hypothetical protein